ncbi:MAG: prolipoprotein diacylglyceryl transferase [Thermomicrobiales bacterium]|nr:prolipoprotein diacylglyceryl transferase [Thermomicrobiales bacterium]
MAGLPATVLTLALAAAPVLTLVLAAWAVGRCAEQAAPDAGLPRVAIADLTLPIVVTALATARVVQVLPTWQSVAANPLDLLRLGGGGQLSALGGAVGASLGFLVFTRQKGLPLLRTADVYALALPLGIAVHSGGCLVRGDCYGRVAGAPFGIIFPGLALPRYPVGLYAAAIALFVFAFVRWFAARRPAPGATALVAMATIAGSDALLAPLRLDEASELLNVPVAAAVAATLAALLVVQAGWIVRGHRWGAPVGDERRPSPGQGVSP